MTAALKRAFKVVTALAAVGVTAVSGYVIVAVVVLVILALAAACWVLSSNERSDRFARILLARRGNAECLEASRPSGKR